MRVWVKLELVKTSSLQEFNWCLQDRAGQLHVHRALKWPGLCQKLQLQNKRWWRWVTSHLRNFEVKSQSFSVIGQCDDFDIGGLDKDNVMMGMMGQILAAVQAGETERKMDVSTFSQRLDDFVKLKWGHWKLHCFWGDRASYGQGKPLADVSWWALQEDVG